MTKRAAIYVRVSSEKQAEGISPESQEADCRALCQRQGYQVVAVYRDIEKYRSGGRMVEPSGTRSDRPQFLRMLADSDAGRFDVLIAWREDRLYRGVTTAVVELKNRVKGGALSIEIVSGGFNPQTMEVLAWAAGVENDARKERTAMGVTNRYASGKLSLSRPVYGCDYVDGALIKNAIEAEWVQKIWQWFGDNVSTAEIRRRLIAADASQRGHVRQKHKWSLGSIVNILHRDDYYTGIFTIKSNGQTYEFPFPQIVDVETYAAVQERRQRYHAFPAGNLRARALVPGSIYCAACGTRMGVSGHNRRQANGEVKKYLYYRCYGYQRLTPLSGCAGFVRQDIVDATVWERIWALLSEPKRFEAALLDRVSQLQVQESDAESAVADLERQLEDLSLERQRVIGFARKGLITDDDLESQLLPLTLQERALRQELADKRLLTGNRAGRLLELADVYRQQIQVGMEGINTEPQTEAQAARQLESRRTIVAAFVNRVVVSGDKSIAVEVAIDLPALSMGDESVLSINSTSSCPLRQLGK